MIRDTLKKAAGLFVEFEPSPEPSMNIEPKTVEQIVREQPGPNLDEIEVQAAPPAPVPTVPTSESKAAAPVVVNPDNTVSFEALYGLANLPAVPFTAEQILELLASLPADLPLESKRATVRVTMSAMAKSMGVSTEQIVSDASRKLAALAAYSDSFNKQVDDYCARTHIEVSHLELQIAEKRKAMDDAQSQKVRVCQACEKESDRLDDVLEFFTLDVAPSKHA